jgi:pyridoxamine 5'-phosphate oxidase family protein
MVSFTNEELEYLQGDRRLSRLAASNASGRPHVVPMSWLYNATLTASDSHRPREETKEQGH